MTDATTEYLPDRRRPSRKQSIVGMIIGGAIVVAGQISTSLAQGGLGAKESVPDHKADIQAVRYEQREAMLAAIAEIQRLKDIVCYDHPKAPQCASPTVVHP